MRRATAAIVAVLLAACTASAQDPESRLIDSTPSLAIRPPSTGSPSADPDPLPNAPPPSKPDRNHLTRLELEQKERREGLRSSDGGFSGYLALGVIVAGSTLVVLLVVVWGSRRRQR